MINRDFVWQKVINSCTNRNISIPDGNVVYFIEAVGTNRVKIGKSKYLPNRWMALASISPVDLLLLKALPGYSKEEQWCHKRFKDYRIKGEWFELSPIKAMIEELGKLGSINNIDTVEVIGLCGCRVPLKISDKEILSKCCDSCCYKNGKNEIGGVNSNGLTIISCCPGILFGEKNSMKGGFTYNLKCKNGHITQHISREVRDAQCSLCLMSR
jgi:hypothetical protein